MEVNAEIVERCMGHCDPTESIQQARGLLHDGLGVSANNKKDITSLRACVPNVTVCVRARVCVRVIRGNLSYTHLHLWYVALPQSNAANSNQAEYDPFFRMLHLQ